MFLLDKLRSILNDNANYSSDDDQNSSSFPHYFFTRGVPLKKYANKVGHAKKETEPSTFRRISGNKKARKPVIQRISVLKRKMRNLSDYASKDGGPEGDRTLDLRIANAALSQLSYRPITFLL